MRKTLNVKGMHCRACEVLLKEVAEEVGAKNVSASTLKGIVEGEFASESQLEQAKKAIRVEGYEVE